MNVSNETANLVACLGDLNKLEDKYFNGLLAIYGNEQTNEYLEATKKFMNIENQLRRVIAQSITNNIIENSQTKEITAI